MHIDEQRSGTISTLSLKGDFWKTTGWELYEHVKRVIEDGIVNVVVDFSRINRINSQGIGVLVSCLKTLRDANGNMKLACASNDIKKAFGIVNLFTFLEVFDTVDEAIKSFQPG